MRVLVMFDLPTEYSEQRKEYRYFRKYLIKNGFIMLQESVYCKLVLNTVSADLTIDNLKKYTPKKGIVQVLTITEKQFSKIQFLVGAIQTDYLDNDERFVEL